MSEAWRNFGEAWWLGKGPAEKWGEVYADSRAPNKIGEEMMGIFYEVASPEKSPDEVMRQHIKDNMEPYIAGPYDVYSN